MKAKLLYITILITIIVAITYGSWDNTKPADNQTWNTAAASIRDNWDALEAILGVDLDMSTGPVLDINDIITKGPWVDPRAYGAVADGVADDSDALQAAIDAAGNSKSVLIVGTLRITKRIEFGTACHLVGSTSNSYYTTSDRAHYHLKCDIVDGAYNSLLYGPSASGKVTVTIENMNIDMNGKVATAILSEANVNGSVMFNLRYLNIHNCGGDGIDIGLGGNTSRIENCYIAGPTGFLDPGTNDFNIGLYVEDSVGIKIGCSDVIVRGNEVKGGFWIGLRIESSDSIISDNFFEQNRTGCYVYEGSNGRFIGNRFAGNWAGGLEIFGGDHTFIGNLIRKNNTSALYTFGSYDGIGVVLTKAYRCTFIGNTLVHQFDGFRFVDVKSCYFFANLGNYLDGEHYNYSSNTIATNHNYGFDRAFSLGLFHIYNQTLTGSFASTTEGYKLNAGGNIYAIGTLASADATPSIKGKVVWLTGGTTTITDFDDGVTGQIITIIGAHSLTIADGTNIILDGGASMSMTSGDTLMLIQLADTYWYQLSESNNN